jgi:hypothetical protein
MTSRVFFFTTDGCPSQRDRFSHPNTVTDMGLTGGLSQASAAGIRKLVEEPNSIDAFVEASSWAPPVREERPKVEKGAGAVVYVS